MHADVNGARNHSSRSSGAEGLSVYTPKQQVLRLLTQRFARKLERLSGSSNASEPGATELKQDAHCRRATSLLQGNPYFREHVDAGLLPQLKGKPRTKKKTARAKAA